VSFTLTNINERIKIITDEVDSLIELIADDSDEVLKYATLSLWIIFSFALLLILLVLYILIVLCC